MSDANIDRKIAMQGLQSQEDFERQMMANSEAMSRTFGGVSDTSSAEEKPKLALEGNELADRAAANFQQALKLAWEHRQDRFASPEEVARFVEELVSQVSEGLLPPGQGIWRNWQTEFPIQSLPGQIEPDLQAFYREFCQRMQGNTDAVEFAGWVEKRFDGEIHAPADGCGRSTRLLSGMVLARSGHGLPNYRDRKEYYQNINKDWPQWQEYYRSLFTEGETR